MGVDGAAVRDACLPVWLVVFWNRQKAKALTVTGTRSEQFRVMDLSPCLSPGRALGLKRAPLVVQR